MVYNENYCLNYSNIIYSFIFKILTGRSSRSNNKKKNETTIDLEKDPKTKEYKPKE